MQPVVFLYLLKIPVDFRPYLAMGLATQSAGRSPGTGTAL
jgi:hypothetical protein